MKVITVNNAIEVIVIRDPKSRSRTKKAKKLNKTIKTKGKNKVFKGTKGRRSDYKKAVICLNKGENLDYSGGNS